MTVIRVEVDAAVDLADGIFIAHGASEQNAAVVASTSSATTACGGYRLCGPNDLVFDAEGGMWFTDRGKLRPHGIDRVGVFYARIDGSYAERVIFPLMGPNGIGLSPDGGTLYVAETPTGRRT